MKSWIRWLRHAWLDADSARRALTPAGLARLEACVRDSEARHRGELRVCVEGGLPWAALRQRLSARERAVELFGALRVWDTEHNNGVLIYLLLADHRIEILADRGLTACVPHAEWQSLVGRLAGALREGRHEDGLRAAIAQVDAWMAAHFPPHETHADVNELPDAVVLL